MTLSRFGVPILALLLAASASGRSQNKPEPKFPSATDEVSQQPAGKQQASPAPEAGAAADSAVRSAESTPQKAPDKAAAYYHFMMAHMYEDMVSMNGRMEYANKAIEEYRLALENDPNSDYLNAGLAELYAKTGRIRDAVLEAQDILKRDGNNLEARRLLGRIYLRSLGDMQAGTQSRLLLLTDRVAQFVRRCPTKFAASRSARFSSSASARLCHAAE